MTRYLLGALCALACIPVPAFAGNASDLDAWFDGDGRRTVEFGGAVEYAEALLVHSSGRLIVGGNSGSSWALAALNQADGSLVGSDALAGGFGEDGPGKTLTIWPRSASLSALVEEPGGKILAAGSALQAGGVPPFATQFALARYNADGRLDTTFGPAGNGTVQTGFTGGSAAGTDVAVQADGKIVVAGEFNPADTQTQVAVARYNTDGTLDTDADSTPATSFGGGDGIRTFSTGGFRSGARAIAIHADDKIVLAGYDQQDDGGPEKFMITRLTTDGDSDTLTFGTSGVTRIELDTSSRADDLAIDSSGRFVVVGTTDFDMDRFNGGQRFALARFTAGGVLDSDFGEGGAEMTSFGPPPVSAAANAVAIQPDGRIVAVGSVSDGSSDSSGGVSKLAVARYESSGALDTTFGTAQTAFPGSADAYGAAVAVQGDGKILAAGLADVTGDFTDVSMALARYAGAPTPDTTAPETQVTGGPTAETEDTTPTFTFSANEPDATFRCRIGSGAFADCNSATSTSGDTTTGSFTSEVLSPGSYTFEVVAKDAAGNEDASAASRSFKIVRPPDNGGGSGPGGQDPAPTGPLVESPANTSRPVLTNPRQPDAARVGDRLTATAGAWSGSPTRYTFQWLRCSETGDVCRSGYQPIPAEDGGVADGTARSHPYVLTSEDLGRLVAVQVRAHNAGASSLPEQVALPSAVRDRPSFYEEVFTLRNFKLIPDARFRLVLDYMPYRGKQVRRGLWDAKKSVRESFPRYSRQEERRIRRGTLPKSRRIDFWTQTEVTEALETLANKNIFVQLTTKGRSISSVPDKYKSTIQPGDVFTQVPLPERQKEQGFVSSAASPPELQVNYWDPALDPKKADPPPQVTTKDNPCEQLKATLLPDKGDGLVESSALEVVNNYSTRRPPCYAQFAWTGDPKIDVARVTKVALRDDKSYVDITITEPEPTPVQPRADVVDMPLTFTPMPAPAANNANRNATFDQRFQLTAGTTNAVRVMAKDQSIGVLPGGKVAGPFSNVSVNAMFDPAGGGQDFTSLNFGTKRDAKWSVETAEAGESKPGQATLNFTLPDEPGTVKFMADGYPSAGEPLDGWVSFDVVKRSTCFVSINGWSYRRAAKGGGWTSVSRCGGGRPLARGASDGGLHSPILAAYCFFFCPFNPNLKADLLRQEGDAAAAQRGLAGGADCNTTPAVTGLGAKVDAPTTGELKQGPTTVVAGGGIGGGTSTGLDLGADGVALTAVSGCASQNQPVDVTKSESVPTAQVIATGGGNLIGQAGGNVIATGGGNVIATGGGNLIGQAGGNLISDKGLGLIGQAGGNVIAVGGGNVIATGGGNLIGQAGGN